MSGTPARSKRGPLTAVLVFLAVVLAAANLILLASREPDMLLPEQRDGDAFRLVGLTVRSHPTTAAAGAVQMTYTFGDRCGTPLGLAVIGQIGRRNQPVEAETQLWFSLLTPPVPPREPGGPRSPLVTVARHELVSDLVDAGDAARLELEFSDLGIPAPAGQAALGIDNLRGAEATIRATAALPSLRAMARGGHCKLTPRDVETFSLLARVLRARVCDDLTAPGSRCYDSALTLYRDLEPDTYRLDLLTRGEDHGFLHLALRIQRDRSGAPAKATYRVLPHSSLRKTANLFFTHPRGRGELLAPADPGFTGLRYRPPLTPEQLGDQHVDLEALLGDTGWVAGSPP